MNPKIASSAADNRTLSIPDKSTLPAIVKQSNLVFCAQIIPDTLEPFGADPSSPAEDILMEALKALCKGNPEFNLKDYRIYIASPLQDQQSAARNMSPTEIKDQKPALKDIVNNGDYVFFVKPSANDTKKLEIWIGDQKILIKDKTKVFIGRRDAKNSINPDIDLALYLGENMLRVSRKQAWLIENNGSWSVCLDENARSPVFLNGEIQLEPGVNYEILNDTKLGFGGFPNQSYLYMTLRITK